MYSINENKNMLSILDKMSVDSVMNCESDCILLNTPYIIEGAVTHDIARTKKERSHK